MAVDSLAARRAVREHLEANFDEYLSSVSTYLRQAYPELQLSNDVSEEIAATVIVRVSHANPEPDDIEKALCKSADDVVRSRRPRLSQAKLLEEVNGPLRSEFSRALPSLRLVQSFSRAPSAAAEGETSGASLVPGTRLVLANPPVDLGASIGFGGALTTETEPGFSMKPSPAEVTSSDLEAVADLPLGANGEQDFEEGVLESGTLSETEMVGSSRVETKHSNVEDAFFADGDAMDAELGGELRAQQEDSEHVGSAEANSAEVRAERDGDRDIAERVHWPDAEEDLWGEDSAPRPQAAGESTGELRQSRVPAATLDAFDDDEELVQDVPVEHAPAPAEEAPAPQSAMSHPLPAVARRSTAAEALAKAELALAEVTVSEPKEGGALLMAQKLSSVPPTQESIRPKAITRSRDEATRTDESPHPRTRRKATTRAKKATSKGSSARGKATAKRSAPKRAAAPARERQPATAAPSGAFVADDLAVLAMLGFPSNPRRAAMLCVTAVSEELGVEGHVDLTPLVAQVVAALDELRGKLERTSPMPPDAHLQWQRTARQATLRAFFSVGK